jgi:hypothetical protein
MAVLEKVERKSAVMAKHACICVDDICLPFKHCGVLG